MIAALSVIAIAFTWLLYESNWMRVRLVAGRISPSVESNSLSERKEGYTIIQGLKSNGYRHSHNRYLIFVSPGIYDVLCGKEWLDKHWADLVDYQPKVEMTIGNVRYNMTIKQPSIIKDVMKANHLTKKQVLAYA